MEIKGVPVNTSNAVSWHVWIAVTAFSLLLSACADVVYIAPTENYVVSDPLHGQETSSSAGKFNAQIIFMADQIERNFDRESLQDTFIVTSFSNLNRLSETTRFGRLVAENLMHELQMRRWKIFEVRLTKDITINESGEFSLSRDINKIKEINRVGGIITGTYSTADGYIIVNARVIDIDTGRVVSSAQSSMPVTWFTEALLFNPDSLQPMKITGNPASGPYMGKKGVIMIERADR